MQRILVLILVLAAGCARHNLVPGQSSAADVEAVMGAAATYAARIAPDGRLIALEQRLTFENAAKLKPEPVKRPDREIWSYPTPRGFLVQLASDGVLRETYFIDDPHWIQPDSPRRR